MSTSGHIMMYVEGTMSTLGGYHEYIRGYHEYIRGISWVHWGISCHNGGNVSVVNS